MRILLLAAVVLLAGFSAFFLLIKEEKEPRALIDIELVVPSGWYLNRKEAKSVFLTKHETLLQRATETFAYGPQMILNIMADENTAESFISSIKAGSSDGYTDIDTVTLAGHEFVRMERRLTEIVRNGDLSYRIFDGNRSYLFYLYPLYVNNANGEEVKNTEDIDSFEEFIRLNIDTILAHTPVLPEEVGHTVLTALRDADYDALEQLTSSAGISWNEEPSLDFSKTDIAKADVSDIVSDKTERLFGYTDGKGDPIMLTNDEYIKKWLYTHDYSNADEVAVNRPLSGGSRPVALFEQIGDRTVVAYHFNGSNSEFPGFTWTTLYLVFDVEEGQYRLRGIAKDNWTI